MYLGGLQKLNRYIAFRKGQQDGITQILEDIDSKSPSSVIELCALAK